MNDLLHFPCELPSSGRALGFALQLQERLPTLVTERLLMRAPRVEDFEQYAEIMCSERASYMDGPMSREDAWADFCNATANWVLHGHGLWTIGHAGDAAGFVRLGFEPGDSEPELGFMLLDRFEGRGIAFEAANAAKAHAFEGLGWTHLVSYIDPRNVRSRKLANRLGGRLTGDQDGAFIYSYTAEADA